MHTIERLLVRGGATFVIPTPELLSITSSPHGGWDQGPVPIIHTYGGYEIRAWLTGSTGNMELRTREAATGNLGPIGLVFSAVPYDDHNAPCVCVLDDGHVVIAWAPHNGEHIYLRVSNTVLGPSFDPDDWGSVIDVVSQIGASGGGGYTYVSITQLRGATGMPVLLTVRDNLTGDTTGRIAYAVSMDHCATWGTKVVLFAGSSGNVPYFSIGTDWASRTDVFTTNTAPGNVGSNADTLHLWIDWTDESYHATDGTDLGAPPFVAADLTLVESGSGGATWPFGASYDQDGDPMAVIMRHLEGFNDNDIQVAQSPGAVWGITTIAQAGGEAVGDRFASGCDIRHDVGTTVYLGQLTAGAWEQFEFTSNDRWVSWFVRQMTFGSTDTNFEIRCPQEPIPGGSQAEFLSGTYFSSSNYNLAINGWGLP